MHKHMHICVYKCINTCRYVYIYIYIYIFMYICIYIYLLYLQFIELQFSKRGHLIGGTIRTYLLEKVTLDLILCIN
jgi:hypothetical protein